MSEWAYRECKRCGNRVHINMTCDKCDGDPWGVREMIQNKIENLITKKVKLLKKLSDVKNDIKFHQNDLKKTYNLKKEKKNKEIPISNKEITVSGMDANVLNEKIFPSESDFYFKD
jgi:hypothetical protein